MAVRRLGRRAPMLLAAGLAAACGGGGRGCDGALELPPGFCAEVVADGVGPARHLAVARSGDVYVALWREGSREGGVLALRDTTGDGRADVRERFGPEAGSGIALRGDALYFATWNAVYRYRLDGSSLVPPGPPEVVARGLPELEHGARSLALDGAGGLYVNVGAPSNACERDYPARDFRGDDPCRELRTSGGIWRFDAAGAGQEFSERARYATGLRHTVALGYDPGSRALFGVPHGIDHFASWWPAAGFSERDAAAVPSETLFRIDPGGDYAFPYCYHDPRAGRMLLSPAYGGDGRTVGRCAGAREPLAAFPAHAAPMALVFYHAAQFPARYRGGAFVAFHGSMYHHPLPPRGYDVAFLPFAGGRPSGPAEVFADARGGWRRRVGATAHRPSGLAVGPDGSLYLADDHGGRIWRIRWRGP